VKSVSDIHREGLDQALRQALGTSQTALRQQAMNQAASHLIHPRLVLESPLLTESHPWYREALIVSDAFEAVTNGMEDPDVLSALDELAPDSPFLPWRHLVLALHFFYENLDEAVEAHVAAIPAASPVHALGTALRSLARSQTSTSTPPLARLMESVSLPDPAVVASVQDVSEGLETENEPLFWEALTDWLEAVAPHHPQQAKAAVLWAWNQLEWREFDEGVLLELATSLWGDAESFRLAALGSLPWDAQGAALLWLRFLVTDVRDGAAKPRAQEARSLLERFHQAASVDGSPTEEWNDTWFNLTRAWNLEADVRQWLDLRWEGNAIETADHPVARASTDGQLDLFSL